jgi:small glutamine-rich tetratricopeptide repeat-containing protein alpha
MMPLLKFSFITGMQNVDALLETGRQLAMQMSNENPELFTQIRQQMEAQGGGAPNEENPNPESEGEKKP